MPQVHVRAKSMVLRESLSRLLGQAGLLAKSFHSRITMKQSEFWGVEGPADAHCAQGRQAIQSLQSAILVAQAGKSQSLGVGVGCCGGCQFLRLLAATGPSVSVTEVLL